MACCRELPFIISEIASRGRLRLKRWIGWWMISLLRLIIE